MAVAAAYLTKIRQALRMQSDTDFNAEITDVVEECRRDLESLGVISAKTTDETDALILGAVRSFARWKIPLNEDSAVRNMNDYMIQRDELRRKRDYRYYTITFIVKTGLTAIPDASITFNGETIETDASGTAIFHGVSAGVNQEYVVSATGYVSQAVDLDVTATATVNVAMSVG